MATRKNMFDFPEPLKSHGHFSILVCGKTGVGKSSLVNLLIGNEVFNVGGPGETGDFRFTTDRVRSSSVEIQGVTVTVFDSPGLQDGSRNEQRYLSDMHRQCRNVDLVLYCIDMTISRWTPPEVRATQLLTEKFGLNFWDKTVIVLTKANMFSQRLRGEDKIDTFQTAFRRFVSKFESQLKDQGVPSRIVARIPAVAAGSDRDGQLPYISQNAAMYSRGNRDFLLDLWLTCIERISARRTFVKVTAPQRFDLRKVESSKEEVMQLINDLRVIVDERH